MAGMQKAMPRAMAPQGRGAVNKGSGGYNTSYVGKHSTAAVKVPAPAFTSKGPIRIPPPEKQHTITREFGGPNGANYATGGTSGQGDTTGALGT